MTTTVQDLLDELQKLPEGARLEFEYTDRQGDVRCLEIDRINTIPYPVIKLVLK